jgi:TRAP-type C4-dicarboxylate transport system, small permease component
MRKLFRYFLQLDDFLSAIFVIVLVAITNLAVFMRFVVGKPLTWSEEMGIALFIFIAFIGMSSVTKADAHLKIDLLIGRFPRKVENVLELFRKLIMIFVLVVVFIYYGIGLMGISVNKMLPVTKIPYSYLDVALPIGAALSLIHLVRKIVKQFKDKGDGMST